MTLYKKIKFIHENINENDVEFDIKFDNYDSYVITFKNDENIVMMLIDDRFDLLDMKINDEFVDIDKLNDVSIDYIKIIDNTILKFNIEKFENDIYDIFDELNIEIDDEIIYDFNENISTLFSSSLIKNMLIDDVEYNNEIDKIVEILTNKINNVENVENVKIYNDEINIEIDKKFHDEIIELNELYDDMKIYF